MMKRPGPVTALLCFLLLAIPSIHAQDVVLPGSTVEGDILRGQGQFLKGMAWYELNEARARELDVKTAHELDQWNRELHEAYERELSASAARRRSVRNERQADAKRRLAEREQRLRTKPTIDDVQSGDALNALLLDLSDPTISESAWRYAKVALPDSLAIPRLIFQFAVRRGDRNSQALTKSLIALGRLDVEDRWPAYLAIDELSPDRQAYEKAYTKVKAESLEGKLTLSAILDLDKAVDALDVKAKTAVPTARNFRSAAVQAVEGIKKAAGMFDASTIGFAQEMIADTHTHRAQTVGELLAFMRKYRLLFAPADKRPEDAEQYIRLYRLLRQQKELFGDKVGTPPPAEPIAKDWVPLFNGRDLSGWEAFQNGRPARLGSSLVADRGELSCSASTLGRIQTVAVYQGFVLRLEYLFPDGGTTSDMGSGVALIPENLNAAFQIDGTSVIGHLEYQLKPGQSGGLAIAWQPITLPRRAEAERPAGHWNEVEIRYEGAKLTFGLNGAVVNQAVLEQYWQCHIALFAQGSDVRFRNIRIIPSSPIQQLGSVNDGNQADSTRDASPPEGVAFRLVNVKTGKALDVKDGSMRPGAALVQFAVSNGPSQLWTVRTARDTHLIINAHSGLSINIPQRSNANRQPLIQWTVVEGEPNQSWVFQKHGQAFRIASRRNGLLIAAPDADGPIVQLFPRGGDDELWHVVSVKR
jgi:Domain of Unknown Function (DUF1080)/Ricin-type beta-trefoil lectin domain-like